MCIDFDGHHSDGSSFVYVNDFFVITENVCTPIGTSSALRKNRSMRVLVYSLAPDSVRICHSGRTGNRGVTVLSVAIVTTGIILTASINQPYSIEHKNHL